MSAPASDTEDEATSNVVLPTPTEVPSSTLSDEGVLALAQQQARDNSPQDDVPPMTLTNLLGNRTPVLTPTTPINTDTPSTDPTTFRAGVRTRRWMNALGSLNEKVEKSAPQSPPRTHHTTQQSGFTPYFGEDEGELEDELETRRAPGTKHAIPSVSETDYTALYERLAEDLFADLETRTERVLMQVTPQLFAGVNEEMAGIEGRAAEAINALGAQLKSNAEEGSAIDALLDKLMQRDSERAHELKDMRTQVYNLSQQIIALTSEVTLLRRSTSQVEVTRPSMSIGPLMQQQEPFGTQPLPPAPKRIQVPTFGQAPTPTGVPSTTSTPSTAVGGHAFRMDTGTSGPTRGFSAEHNTQMANRNAPPKSKEPEAHVISTTQQSSFSMNRPPDTSVFEHIRDSDQLTNQQFGHYAAVMLFYGVDLQKQDQQYLRSRTWGTLKTGLQRAKANFEATFKH